MTSLGIQGTQVGRWRGARWPGALVALLVGAAVLPAAVGTPIVVPVVQSKLTAGDAAAGDLFGVVAVDGDTMVVGAFLDDTPAGADAGSAYVFRRSGLGWVQEAMLTAGDGAPGDRFGTSVAISGGTIAVGAWFHSTPQGPYTGTVYVFTRGGGAWTQQAELVHADARAADLLGFDLALQGDTLVAGAHLQDPGGIGNAGAAYVFTRAGTTWSQQAKLGAHDAAAGDLFGGAVAFDGDTIVVGAPGDDNARGVDAGALYVFARSGGGWEWTGKYSAADGKPGEFFPTRLALEGDTLVATSWFHDHPLLGPDTGAAYVFVRGDLGVWSVQALLTVLDAAPGDRFGMSADVLGDTVVIGAGTDDDPVAGLDAGSAHGFVRAGTMWAPAGKLTALDAGDGDRFGSSVALAKDTLVVGAVLADTPAGPRAGSAYVFQVLPA